VAAFGLVTAIGATLMAAPAFGAAPPNEAGTNCHGVWLSYESTSDMAPGQLHKDFGTSVKMSKPSPTSSAAEHRLPLGHMGAKGHGASFDQVSGPLLRTRSQRHPRSYARPRHGEGRVASHSADMPG
jgi:hypothetical protein